MSNYSNNLVYEEYAADPPARSQEDAVASFSVSLQSVLEEEYDIDDTDIVVDDYLTSLSTLKKLGHTYADLLYPDSQATSEIPPRTGERSDETGVLLPKTFGDLPSEPPQEPELTTDSLEDI